MHRPDRSTFFLSPTSPVNYFSPNDFIHREKRPKSAVSESNSEATDSFSRKRLKTVTEYDEENLTSTSKFLDDETLRPEIHLPHFQNLKKEKTLDTLLTQDSVNLSPHKTDKLTVVTVEDRKLTAPILNHGHGIEQPLSVSSDYSEDNLSMPSTRAIEELETPRLNPKLMMTVPRPPSPDKTTPTNFRRRSRSKSISKKSSYSPVKKSLENLNFSDSESDVSPHNFSPTHPSNLSPIDFSVSQKLKSQVEDKLIQLHTPKIEPIEPDFEGLEPYGISVTSKVLNSPADKNSKITVIQHEPSANAQKPPVARLKRKSLSRSPSPRKNKLDNLVILSNRTSKNSSPVNRVSTSNSFSKGDQPSKTALGRSLSHRTMTPADSYKTVVSNVSTDPYPDYVVPSNWKELGTSNLRVDKNLPPIVGGQTAKIPATAKPKRKVFTEKLDFSSDSDSEFYNDSNPFKSKLGKHSYRTTKNTQRRTQKRTQRRIQRRTQRYIQTYKKTERNTQ